MTVPQAPPPRPRPCRWPDGGCGRPILDVRTAGGARQVLDPTPTKGVVLGEPMLGLDSNPVLVGGTSGTATARIRVAKVVDVYVDHHATCPKWKARLERDRAAKAGGGDGPAADL